MITLAIDASTYAGDVCLLDGDRVVAEAQVEMKGAEHERLMPAVAAVLADASVPVSSVQRVVCGAGPGSFTSLRIAAGIAKGVAVGLNVPMYAVPSLALVVAGAALAPGDYLVALDALRGEEYVALYRVGVDGVVVGLERPRLVAAGDVAALAAEFGALLVSPSRRADAIVARPRACGVSRLDPNLGLREPVDVERWEPEYGRLAEAQVRWEAAHGRSLSGA